MSGTNFDVGQVLTANSSAERMNVRFGQRVERLPDHWRVGSEVSALKYAAIIVGAKLNVFRMSASLLV
jgi:hypothetical protein